MSNTRKVQYKRYCGFEEMIISSDSRDSFEITCQICGYAKWTEEKMPDNEDIELAKQTLSKMNAVERQKAVDLFDEDNTPLVVRLKELR